MAWQKRKPHRSSDSKFDRQRSPLRELTSDPETVGARIFFGEFTSDITKQDLIDHFSQWGKVLGVTCNKNRFGFVQFENDYAAQTCLMAGSSVIIRGTTINIKAARVDPQSASTHQASGSSQRDGPSRSDFIPNYESPKSQRGDRFHDSHNRRNGHGKYDNSRHHDSYHHRDSGSAYGSSTQEPSLPSTDYHRGEVDPYFSSRSCDVSSSSYLSILDPLDPSRPNDVEIVVPNKSQRAFAESLEARLKRSHLLVDLLFPPPEISPSQVLSDLSARRCLYVLLATSENEKHNSVTVHILHGEQQEHRNMPVEDALHLIHVNFEEYVRKTRLRNERQVVPRDIRNLLLDLLEMRPLSMGDLDKVIKYLRERQNALVDDQIEQKRETTGNHSSGVTAGLGMNNMVAYPGFNYMATSAVPVNASQAVIPGVVGSSAMTAVSVPPAHNSASNSVETVPSVGGYAASYSGLAQSGIVGTYSLTTQVVPNSQQSHAVIQPPPSGVQPPQLKELNFQDKILGIIKNQGVNNAGMSVPSPVAPPPPNAVAAHPSSTYLAPQQPVWLSQQQTSNENEKLVQAGVAAYNPWSH